MAQDTRHLGILGSGVAHARLAQSSARERREIRWSIVVEIALNSCAIYFFCLSKSRIWWLAEEFRGEIRYTSLAGCSEQEFVMMGRSVWIAAVFLGMNVASARSLHQSPLGARRRGLSLKQ